MLLLYLHSNFRFPPRKEIRDGNASSAVRSRSFSVPADRRYRYPAIRSSAFRKESARSRDRWPILPRWRERKPVALSGHPHRQSVGYDKKSHTCFKSKRSTVGSGVYSIFRYIAFCVNALGRGFYQNEKMPFHFDKSGRCKDDRVFADNDLIVMYLVAWRIAVASRLSCDRNEM